MQKNRKLIIIGDSAFAEIAYEYFLNDSDYDVVGFSVEEAYLKRDTLFGIPIVPFESLGRFYDIATHEVFVAVVYTKLNRLRTRLMKSAKQKGYKLASFISPHAFVWKNVKMEEHCFIFENNVVQPFVQLGNNVILWSGNHIGHHSVIKDNNFISSHVVISGYAEIGENSFLGVNATVTNNVKIGKDNWIGPGVTISKDTKPGALYGPYQTEPSRVTALRFFDVED